VGVAIRFAAAARRRVRVGVAIRFAAAARRRVRVGSAVRFTAAARRRVRVGLAVRLTRMVGVAAMAPATAAAPVIGRIGFLALALNAFVTDALPPAAARLAVFFEVWGHTPAANTLKGAATLGSPRVIAAISTAFALGRGWRVWGAALDVGRPLAKTWVWA